MEVCMAIDLTKEKLISFREAVELLPRRRRGRKVHVATLYRWATHGLHGVRLETVQCGGTRVTTIEALQRFFRQLEGQRDDVKSPRTYAKRCRDSGRAVEQLAAEGI